MRHVRPLTVLFLLVPALAAAQAAAPPLAPSRASRDTYSAVMDVLRPTRARLTDDQIARLMIQDTKYRARDIYPTLSPELEKVFEEWKKTHPRDEHGSSGRRP